MKEKKPKFIFNMGKVPHIPIGAEVELLYRDGHKRIVTTKFRFFYDPDVWIKSSWRRVDDIIGYRII